jgi:hypothetical protein
VDAGTDFGRLHWHHADTAATVKENHAGRAANQSSSDSASQSFTTGKFLCDKINPVAPDSH